VKRPQGLASSCRDLLRYRQLPAATGGEVLNYGIKRIRRGTGSECDCVFGRNQEVRELGERTYERLRSIARSLRLNSTSSMLRAPVVLPGPRDMRCFGLYRRQRVIGQSAL
jgi:hypothetical protein